MRTRRSSLLLCEELHCIVVCPHSAIRAQYSNMFRDAGGALRFMWYKDQKAVSHCLTAIDIVTSASGPGMTTDPDPSS